MAAAPSPETYKEVILFLATAGVVVPLFHRLRISPVLGFLGAGALLGPYGLGRFVAEAPWLSWVTIGDRDEISHLAELGVVFLLFMIGLELSWERLRVLRRLVFGLGSLQVVLCTAAIAGVVHFLGVAPSAAILVGLALALSSTAIVIPVLSEQKRLGSPTGRASFAVLLFQDLAVAPMLFTITVLGSRTGEGFGAAFTLALAQAALALVAILGIGRLALRPLFQLVAATRSAELFMAASLLVVVATGLLAALSGLSAALGAFIAGLLLAETEYRRAIEATIDPFKGLLLGVFFVSVGMGLDLSRLLADPITILAGATALVILKTVIIVALAVAFRLPRPVALDTGSAAWARRRIRVRHSGSRRGGRARPLRHRADGARRRDPDHDRHPRCWRESAAAFAGDLSGGTAVPSEPPPAAERGRVIVAGSGASAARREMLARHNVPYLAIDSDPALVQRQRAAGKPVYFGDSATPTSCGVAASTRRAASS
jgi:CPA2 family monovalent cation:H+ antiporter-2